MIKALFDCQTTASEYGQASKDACARLARRVKSCARCRYCDTCGRLERPLPRLGRYVAHIAVLCEQAQYGLPRMGYCRAVVTPLPATLEDDASVLVKIKVAIPKARRSNTIYLHGGEDDYTIISQIFKNWRALVLGG